MQVLSKRQKTLLITFCLLPFYLPATAQELNIRNILDSQNVLTTNQGTYINTIYGQTTDMLVHSINLKPQNVKGLRLRIKGKVGNTLRYTSYITGSEIPEVVKALNSIIATAESNRDKEIDIEMNYRTRDGVNFVYYQENKSPRFYIEAGSLESLMAGYGGDMSKYTVSAAIEFDDIKELNKIRDILVKLQN